MESEMPGPEYEPLTTRIRDTARRYWLVYVGLTALMVLILASFGWSGVDPLMSEFQAAAHAFTTLPTGGFSPQARSIEPFAPASQWVIGAVHGTRRRQLRAPLPGARAAGEPVPRRGVPPLPRPSLPRDAGLLLLELLRADIYARGRGSDPPGNACRSSR